MSASSPTTASGDTTPTGIRTPTSITGRSVNSYSNDSEEEDLAREVCNKFSIQPQGSRPCMASLNNSDTELFAADSFANLRYRTTSAYGKPDISLAVTSFSFSAQGAPAFMISPAHQTISGFDVLLTKGKNSRLKSLSFAWLELSPNTVSSRLWQHGRCIIGGKAPTFSEARDEGYSVGALPTSILFEHPFDVPPKVVLFLAGILSNRNTCRLTISSTKITERGFSILIGSGFGLLKTDKVKISWIAYSSKLRGVHSGSVDTAQFRTTSQPQTFNMGYEAFPEGMFKKAPKVLVGLNHFDLMAGKEQNLKCFASNVNQLGMCWNTDSWGDTVVYSAGLSYLAIEKD